MAHDSRPLRELPNFSNSDDVKAWRQDWENNIADECQEDILFLIQGVSVESSFHEYDYKGQELASMNDLIAALDEYMFEPNDEALKNNMLVALSKIPEPKQDMLLSARTTLFKHLNFEETAKQKTDEIMQNIFGRNDDFPSP